LNPLRAFIRGYRLAVSNLELAGGYLCASVLFALSMVVPIGLFAWEFFRILGQEAPAASAGPRFVLTLESHWWFIAVWAVGLGIWVTALSVGYLFVQAGILGQLVRGERSAGPAEPCGAGKLGFSRRMRVFTFRGFLDDAAAFGGRLTLLASMYGFVLTLGLLLLASAGLAAFYAGILHRWVIPFEVVGFLLLVFVLVVLALVLGLHYRLAAVLAVEGACSPGQAVRRANGIIRKEFWPFLGLCGLSILLSWVVGAIFAAMAAPVSLLALVPSLLIPMIAARFVLLLVQSAVGSLVYVATMGAFVAFASGWRGGGANVREAGFDRTERATVM